MSGVGLQLLPMAALESSPWGRLPVPTAMLCYTSRSGTRELVFCVWEETLSASCGQPARSWMSRRLALAARCSPVHPSPGSSRYGICAGGRPND